MHFSAALPGVNRRRVQRSNPFVVKVNAFLPDPPPPPFLASKREKNTGRKHEPPLPPPDALSLLYPGGRRRSGEKEAVTLDSIEGQMMAWAISLSFSLLFSMAACTVNLFPLPLCHQIANCWRKRFFLSDPSFSLSHCPFAK